MRKLLLVGALMATAISAVPVNAGEPYWQHGFGFLESLAFRSNRWIHSNGPLYNYGPYHTPGHVRMHIPHPYYGQYVPADPSLWGPGHGAGYGYGAPVNYGYPVGAAPMAAPAPAAAPAVAPAVAPAAPEPKVLPRVLPASNARPRILPAAYNPLYPAWLTNR